MVRMFKPLALVVAAVIVSSPAFAQGTGPLGLDMDPFHIFTPTPAPAPAPAPMMKRHRAHHHKK